MPVEIFCIDLLFHRICPLISGTQGNLLAIADSTEEPDPAAPDW
jgi:hypothetical protein